MITKAVQQFQLGTVMNTEKEVRGTLASLINAGYDGIELCGFMIRPTGMFVKLLTRAVGMPIGRGGKLDWPALIREFDLKVPGIHEDIGRLEKESRAVINQAHTFDTKYVILTGMYGYNYCDRESVLRLADRLNVIGRQLTGENLSFLYHNHNVELAKVAPHQTAYELLIQNLDPDYVNFEFDSYWMTDAGVNVSEIMKELGSRMKLWHINDRGIKKEGTAMTPIAKYDSKELGYGCMDLDTLMKIALHNGIDAVILESHRNWAGGSPVKSFELSAEYLKKW